MEKPCCEAAAARMTKKLTLPDGFQVGILNLESILKEVAELKLSNAEAIKRELLERVKAHNYVVSSAEHEYSVALFREYRRQLETSS
jgi:hypothetical protein